MTPQQEYDAAVAAFRARNLEEGTEHLRRAALAGHAEAQDLLARIYFAQIKDRHDIADLEAAAQGGDHVALFVLAMCFVEGRLIDKDPDKALTALRLAASQGNQMALAIQGYVRTCCEGGEG